MTVSALRTTTSKPSYDGTRMARVNNNKKRSKNNKSPNVVWET